MGAVVWGVEAEVWAVEAVVWAVEAVEAVVLGGGGGGPALLFYGWAAMRCRQLREPKMVLPMRTLVLPISTACS